MLLKEEGSVLGNNAMNCKRKEIGKRLIRQKEEEIC